MADVSFRFLLYKHLLLFRIYVQLVSYGQFEYLNIPRQDSLVCLVVFLCLLFLLKGYFQFIIAALANASGTLITNSGPGKVKIN